MSDPKYNKYAGTVRFDDDNIVDIDLQPDTENITVKLNGSEVTGGSELPEVDSSDNGDVLTVVSGEWTNAAPASQLPAVSGSDNGNVLTVVEGVWTKAAPAGGSDLVVVDLVYEMEDDTPVVATVDKTYDDLMPLIQAGNYNIICKLHTANSDNNMYMRMISSLPATQDSDGSVVFQTNYAYTGYLDIIEYATFSNDTDSLTFAHIIGGGN